MTNSVGVRKRKQSMRRYTVRIRDSDLDSLTTSIIHRELRKLMVRERRSESQVIAIIMEKFFYEFLSVDENNEEL